jgi:hypothetical protein
MKKLQAARAAMVAMAALGIIAATPTYAAGLENGTTTVNSNQPQSQKPQSPGSPNTQNLPNIPGGQIPALAPDVKVTFVSEVSNNGSKTWTYTLANVGGSTARGVKLEKVVVRNGYSGSHSIQTLTTTDTFGDMAAGASKTITFSCSPQVGKPPCDSSSAHAYSTSYDSNPGNDWATS